MCAIGILLYYGWGVGRDTRGAVAWFNAASEAEVRVFKHEIYPPLPQPPHPPQPPLTPLSSPT